MPKRHKPRKAQTEIKAANEELQKKLAEALAKTDEYKDGWQRSVADFQNYRKRVDAERDDTYQNAVGNIIKRYLPVLDDLERALGHARKAWHGRMGLS